MTHYLEREGQPRLAYNFTPPSKDGADWPVVMFCGGYRSDMGGTKAMYLEGACKKRGQGYVRFDYSGHGESGGDFKDGTIGSWFSDALAILNTVVEGPVLLVGSSMGGWIALLLAQARPERVAGLIGIAPAPDFTQEVYAKLTPEQQISIQELGYLSVPNDYSDEPYYFTKALFEDGERNLLLNSPKVAPFPMHLIHGKLDTDVPFETSLRIKQVYQGDIIDITCVEDGDHRLSRPQDLELIDAVIRQLSA